jgi:hypothetical protein
MIAGFANEPKFKMHKLSQSEGLSSNVKPDNDVSRKKVRIPNKRICGSGLGGDPGRAHVRSHQGP